MARVNTVANSGSFKLQGAKELSAALRAVGSEMATTIGRRADRLAATEMSKIMIATAPVSHGKQSPGSAKFGHLRDNIKVRLARARVENVIVYNITVGAAFWGFFNEFGTKNQPAHPWMRSAFDASVQLAVKAQIRELGTGIEAAAKKAARLSGPV